MPEPEDRAPSRPCPRVDGAELVAEQCADMLRDESRLEAESVERVYFPETVEDVVSALREAAGDGEPVTVSGARTGIAGGAVPVDARRVLSIARMKRLLEVGFDARAGETGEAFARVEAGITLAELASALAAFDWSSLPGLRGGGAATRRWYYPVDPTESTAEVGGTIATDASGGRSYRYGPTREWVRALTVVMADGKLARVRRGDPPAGGGVRAEGGTLREPTLFGERALELPKLTELRKPGCKCVAGYFLEPDADLVDILVGSEGTLGVIAEAELRLAPEPANVLSLMCFLARGGGADAAGNADDAALALVEALRAETRLEPLTIEYLGGKALELVREEKELSGDEKIPAVPAEAGAAVFIEEPYADEAELDRRVEAIDELLSAHGGSLDDTWAGDDEATCERIRLLRHAVPEAVNNRIARNRREVPSIHKVGTDLAVPAAASGEMLAAYRERLPASGLEYVVFGHAGESHLHINMIPRTEEELARAKALHEDLARVAVSLGGAVTAEHGIGRLKRSLLEIQYGEEGVAALRRVKDFFDPGSLLNPGVLFSARG